MSTEFYCEEFPTEQNGKQVQTLKDLLEACPEDRFHFMTPFGYVDLNTHDAGQLRQGAVADVLRAEGVGEAAAAQPLLFQHAQDLFRRNGLAAADLEIPNEEGIGKEQREHERQPREQRVAAAEAAQEKGRARRVLDGQRGVERREELSDAIAEMQACRGAYLLEVRVEGEDNVFPMVPAGAPVAAIRLE